MTKTNAELVNRARRFSSGDTTANFLVEELANALASTEANARESVMNLVAEVTALGADRDEVIDVLAAALRVTFNPMLDWERRVEKVRDILAPPLSNREQAE